MKTSDIVEWHVRALTDPQTDVLPVTVDLPQWTTRLREHESLLAGLLPQDCPPVGGLKSDALMQVMTRVFLARVSARGPQAWDRELVRQVYGARIDGCDLIYYPARSVQRLVVHFSSMAPNRFDRYSHYWDPSQAWAGDTAHLFFKDDSQRYFLGDDERPMAAVHARLIRQFAAASGLDGRCVYTVGGSMGGYGALYHAFTLGLAGAIVCAPQVTMRALQAHTHLNWLRNARATGEQWVDLDMLVHRSAHRPSLYLEVGRYPADRLAADALREAFDARPGLLLLRQAAWTEHTQSHVLSRPLVSSTIQLFEAHRAMDALYAVDA